MFPQRLRPVLFCALRWSASPAVLLAVWLTGALPARTAPAAEFSTANFRVNAATPQAARYVAERAEELRRDLAEEWLGEELADWSEPCRVTVDADSERLMGDTTYLIGRTRITRWRMELRGPLDRILETLLPHEVVHTILASHFRCAIPRWADEGAALLAEDPAEQQRLWRLEQRRLIGEDQPPLAELLRASEYPAQRDEIRTFYVRGASLTSFLAAAGKPRFLEFIRAGMSEGWDASVRVHYGFTGVAELEACWLEWLRAGRPEIALDDAQLLSAGVGRTEREAAGRIEVAGGSSQIRHQSRDAAVDLEARSNGR